MTQYVRIKLEGGGTYDLRYFFDRYGIKVPPILPVGGFVGAANLMDCVTESKSEWFVGEYGFILKDARPCTFTPARGQLGIFEVKP